MGFPSLIYDMVMKQDSLLVENWTDLSIDAKLINADPKLFSGKHKNDIEGEQSAPHVQEDVPTYSHQRRLLTNLIKVIKYLVEEHVQNPDVEEENEDWRPATTSRCVQETCNFLFITL